MAKRGAPAPLIDPSEEHTALGLERLIFFSDAVFAIAITLLALEIRLPAGAGELTDAGLLAALWGLRFQVLAFVISFLVIGVFWIGHHRRFMLIRRYDKRLLWLNLALLMFVAFVPFPTAVLSDSGNRTATIFYALTMALIGLLHLATWRYAAAAHLLDAHVSAQQVRRETLHLWLAPGVFLLSVVIALLNADAAKYFWLLLLPLSYIVR